MTDLKWALTLVLAACLMACGEEGGTGDAMSPAETPDPSESRAQVILGLTGDALNGATLYGVNCEACHGQTGTGNTGTELRGLSFTEELITSVLEGKNYMPAFGTVLADQEIADIIAHVESF